MFGCIVTAVLLKVLTKRYPYELTRDGGGEERPHSGEVSSGEV